MAILDFPDNFFNCFLSIDYLLGQLISEGFRRSAVLQRFTADIVRRLFCFVSLFHIEFSTWKFSAEHSICISVSLPDICMFFIFTV